MIPPEQDAQLVADRKPRASGDDPPPESPRRCRRYVNPARAGMIRSEIIFSLSSRGKPRASGDDPRWLVYKWMYDR